MQTMLWIGPRISVKIIAHLGLTGMNLKRSQEQSEYPEHPNTNQATEEASYNTHWCFDAVSSAHPIRMMKAIMMLRTMANRLKNRQPRTMKYPTLLLRMRLWYLMSSMISLDQSMKSRNLLLGEDRSTSYLNCCFTSSRSTLCRPRGE